MQGYQNWLNWPTMVWWCRLTINFCCINKGKYLFLQRNAVETQRENIVVDIAVGLFADGALVVAACAL